MVKKYYFDTSIWLDFLENRNEPNMPKGQWIKELVNKVINDGSLIVYSNANKEELIKQGYSIYELNNLFSPLKKILMYVEFTKKQFGKAKDLANKKNVPIFDALHVLIAKDNKSILVTLDKHFHQFKDISLVKSPREII